MKFVRSYNLILIPADVIRCDTRPRGRKRNQQCDEAGPPGQRVKAQSRRDPAPSHRSRHQERYFQTVVSRHDRKETDSSIKQSGSEPLEEMKRERESETSVINRE